METETKTEGGVDTTNNEVEVGENKEVETISISKEEYDRTIQTLGSLKREIKDLKKPKEESLEKTSKKDVRTNENVNILERVEKMALKQAGLTHQDDIDLAKKTAKKWGLDLEDVLADDDFKLKLERQQSVRQNLEAVNEIKGGNNSGIQAKNTPDYWVAKGVPPTPTDIPDGNLRRKIVPEVLNKIKGSSKGKTFYND